FSSRRRHTRWPRDWSSDVCSSDLSWGRDRGASEARLEPAHRRRGKPGPLFLSDARASDLKVDTTFRIHPKPFFNLAHRTRRKTRSEEHTSELQSRGHLVCRLLLEK